MPQTTVAPEASLDNQQRDWLKKMAAALQLKLGGDADQASGKAADAGLAAKCQQLKSAVVPKVKDAVAADASKRDKIKQLLEAATKQESQGAYAEAFESWKELAVTVKEALGISGGSAPSDDARGGTKGGTTTAPTGKSSGTPPTPPPKPPGTSKAPTPPPTPSLDDEGSTPKSPEQVAYEKELAAIKKLVDALNKHAHKAHIADELTSINTDLGKADTAAKANKCTDAMKELAKAKDTAGKAKDFADKYEAYAKKRAAAQFLTNAFKDALATGLDSAGNPTYLEKQNIAITDADNLAKAPTRDYVGATAKVDAVTTALSQKVTDWYVTPNTPKIQNLKTGAQKVFLADQIKAIEDQMASVNANIAAKDYRKALMGGPRLNTLIGAAVAAADRRGKFDDQRVKTVAAIDSVKAFKALAPKVDDFNKRLKEADDQGSLATRQFENGAEALLKIEDDAKALAKNGPAADTYANDRKLADDAYAALSKHKQAATQKPMLAGIKTKLDKAAELAKDPTKSAAANSELKLAKQEIDNAAHVLGLVDNVSAAAGSATDVKTGKQALTDLKATIADVKKNKYAPDFATQLTAIDEKVAAAEKELKSSKTVPNAIKDIKTIGSDLGKLMIQMTQQDTYSAERVSLQMRLGIVKAMPEAAAIQAKTTPVETALTDAEAQDKAHAFDKRAAAMEKGRDAMTVAEKTAADCKTYNARQKTLETAVTGSSLTADQKKVVTDLIKPATQKGTALEYDEATKLLVKAEGEFESLQIGGFAEQTPPDLAKIEAAAKRMMKSGNAKEIDKLIQKLPDTTQHDVLKKLAKERFGIELKTDADTETKSAKAMLNMLAKVPEDVVGNASLKTVERRDPNDNGGFYRASEQLVVMNGRPGQSTQGFGATIADELPAKVDSNCQPEDASTVDYFDFATLHELGHSVDDNLQFMNSRMGKAEFGNWQSYGGDIGPIIDAVAKWAKYDSTPEQKQAISDLIQGNKFDWPTAPSGKETEWDKAKQKVEDWHGLATWDQIWWNQSSVSKINIGGTVYHQAYARQWVSYDFDARKKGLTGYQFRAPGEWFAELYAAYRMDKLKSGHPAMKWLKDLKV